ncbi:hypothetical protein FSS13T_12620 [Flavobacterium saliperosum S13]|uniref:Uncharacterized protein n=1 Tax=Flavobacterium saliperosum S13 TaxID=1341155 RepID=A0ABN0QH74_9FLAO|nr:hypothetical protein FSS13T_12620 [Flavobacterium saliperosum S13]
MVPVGTVHVGCCVTGTGTGVGKMVTVVVNEVTPHPEVTGKL